MRTGTLRSFPHLPSTLRTPVDLIHTTGNAITHEKLYRLTHQGLALFKLVQLILSHSRKNKFIHGLPLALLVDHWPAYTDFQTGEIEGSQVLRNGADTVMPPCSTLTHHFNATTGKIDIVMEHQQVLQGNFEIIDERSNALAGAIHVGLGFEEQHVVPAEGTLTVQPIHFTAFHDTTG